MSESAYTRRRSNWIDRSGSLAAATTSQQFAPANESRSYLLIQNISAEDLWINETIPAVADQPSIKIAAGATLIFDGPFIPTGALNIIGATLGQKFVVKEG